MQYRILQILFIAILNFNITVYAMSVQTYINCTSIDAS